MDLERFTKLVSDPARIKADLQQMLKNALAKERPDCAAVAKDVLDRRFPGWDKVSSKRGGATPTSVSFRGARQHCPTAKEAYVWLINRFISTYPEPFVNINWETEFVAKGRNRNYFGRSPERMFRGSPHLAEDRNNYERLTNGWYVNLNLNNDQKLEILGKFAAVAKLKFDDWSWEVSGAPQPLDVSTL